MHLFRALTVSALLLFAARAPAADPIDAEQVYSALQKRPSERERNTYLKATAGTAVKGSGVLNSMTPRSYFDTSIPDSDPFVALIQSDPSRKIVCGLPKGVLDTLGWLKEGSAVAFAGRLVDAQVWSEGLTLYLGDCTLGRR